MIGHFEFTLQVTRSQDVLSVDRRYSDFELLRKAICCVFPGLFISPLPPKDAFIALQKEDSDTVLERKHGIKNFILSIVGHQTLGHDDMVTEFLTIRTQHQFDAYKQSLEQKINERAYLINNL
jgi:hypothetical protein